MRMVSHQTPGMLALLWFYNTPVCIQSVFLS